MNQVHKETLTSVDNSLPNRQGLEVEIFGMEGIPEEVAQAHNQRTWRRPRRMFVSPLCHLTNFDF